MPFSWLHFNITMIIYFVAYIIVIGLVCTLAIVFHRIAKKRAIYKAEKFKDTAPRADPFEEKIKANKLKPDRSITFGQNELVYDCGKGKVLIQSNEMPSGILLSIKDILSYSLIKDGQTIRQASGGVERSVSDTGKGDGAVLCSDLRMIIRIQNKRYNEIILPFITFSIESEPGYHAAVNAAYEMAEILDTMMQQGPFVKMKTVKTSLDA